MEMCIYTYTLKIDAKITTAWVSNYFQMWSKLTEGDCIKIGNYPTKQKKTKTSPPKGSNQNLSWFQRQDVADHIANSLVSSLLNLRGAHEEAHKKSHQLFIPTRNRFYYITLLQQEYNHAFLPTLPNPKTYFLRTCSLAAQYREEYWERKKTMLSISQDIYTQAEKRLLELQSTILKSHKATSCISCILISSHQDTYLGKRKQEVFVRDMLWNIVLS